MPPLIKRQHVCGTGARLKGGDFRGQFSHASVLAESGNIDQALFWFERALAGGDLKFLKVASVTLLNARHPQIRALATAYQQRAAEIL